MRHRSRGLQTWAYRKTWSRRQAACAVGPGSGPVRHGKQAWQELDPQRGEYPQLSILLERGRKRGEEHLALPRVGQRDEFLQLVDDQQNPAHPRSSQGPDKQAAIPPLRAAKLRHELLPVGVFVPIKATELELAMSGQRA